MQVDSRLGIVEELVRVLEEGRAGFEEAADLLTYDESTDWLEAELRDFAKERRRMAAELRELAAEAGMAVPEETSGEGDVHRAWAAMKDTFTESGPLAVLSGAAAGEGVALAHLQSALDAADLPDEVEALVERQAIMVEAAHDRLVRLKERYAG